MVYVCKVLEDGFASVVRIHNGVLVEYRNRLLGYKMTKKQKKMMKRELWILLHSLWKNPFRYRYLLSRSYELFEDIGFTNPPYEIVEFESKTKFYHLHEMIEWEGKIVKLRDIPEIIEIIEIKK